MPLDLDDLAEVKPIFEDIPGWSELEGLGTKVALTEATLPANARAFIDRVSALVATPVWVASVGPGRLETIVRHNPFDAASAS
jgi:adenylosuccinate synthase